MELSEKANLLYKQWVLEVKEEDRVSRYSNKNRPLLIENLVLMFKSNDIPVEDVLFYKRKIKEVLITKEGSKGLGKHKNWATCAEDDFEGIVSRLYIKAPETSTEASNGLVLKPVTIKYGHGHIIPRNNHITDWSKKKFAENWNESVNLLCHTVNHSLNDLFCKEYL